jgi:chromate transporter
MTGLPAGVIVPDAAALWSLFVHFALLSMLAIGGAIATAPDMHRYVVDERHWLTDTQFAGSIALAQAAPGPNVLFVAVIGFNIAGLPGLVATLSGSLLPSTVFALWVGRLRARRRDSRTLRAFTEGMAPLTIGLLLSTGWVLTEPSRTHWGTVPMILGTIWYMRATRLSPVWIIALGAVAGIFGLV